MILPHVRPRWLVAAISAFVGASLRAVPAFAAGSNMPWEQPLQQILQSIEGPVSKIIAVIISGCVAERQRQAGHDDERPEHEPGDPEAEPKPDRRGKGAVEDRHRPRRV